MPIRLLVGIAAVRQSGALVGWTSDDFFVPPSLWGAGIGWYFLDRLLRELRASDLCYVIAKAPRRNHVNPATVADERGFIDQYRKIGFRLQRPSDVVNGRPIDLDFLRRLSYADGDTLLVLDFSRWNRSG